MGIGAESEGIGPAIFSMSGARQGTRNVRMKPIHRTFPAGEKSTEPDNEFAIEHPEGPGRVGWSPDATPIRNFLAKACAHYRFSSTTLRGGANTLDFK